MKGKLWGAMAIVITLGAAIYFEDGKWLVIIPAIIAVAAGTIGLILGTFAGLRALGILMAARAVGARIVPPKSPSRPRTKLLSFLDIAPTPFTDEPRLAFRAVIAAHAGAIVVPCVVSTFLFGLAVSVFGTVSPWLIPPGGLWMLALGSAIPFRSEGEKSDGQSLMDWWRLNDRDRQAALGMAIVAWITGRRPAEWPERCLRFAASSADSSVRSFAAGYLSDRAADRGERRAAVRWATVALASSPVTLFVLARLRLAIVRTEAGEDDPASEVSATAISSMDPPVVYAAALLRAKRGKGGNEAAEGALEALEAASPGYTFPLERDRVAALRSTT